MAVQTITLDGKKYAILNVVEYDRLRALAAEDDLPTLPRPDESGNFPAVEYARVSLARKLIRQRRAAGLTQADLARRAGIRPETLNRVERGKATPDIATVQKIARAIEQAEADAAAG